jgi:hypothetical protein
MTADSCTCGECFACTARAYNKRREAEIVNVTITACQERLCEAADRFEGKAQIAGGIATAMARHYREAAELLHTLRRPA